MTFVEMLEEESRDTTRLAESLSLAVLIEPALLRTARLELHPELEVGVEGDVWFSTFVASRGPDGIIFSHEAAEGLRARLDGGRRAAAWNLLKRMHANASPALRLEEEIAWLLASERDVALSRTRDLLRSAIASLVGGERSGLAHWALQAVHRLPQEVLELEEMSMLATAAVMRLGGRVEQDRVPDWMAWMLPGGVSKKQSIRFTLFPGVLELQAIDEQTGKDPGDVITVPALQPLRLEVHTPEQRQTVVLDEHAPARVRVADGPIELRVSDGSVYELTPSAELESIWRREVVRFERLFDEYRPGMIPSELVGELQRESSRGGHIVLVRGQPGSGKTALLTALARSAGDRPVAWHFFSSRSREWRDPESAWRSLAAQIERRFPALRHRWASQLDRLRDLTARVPAEPSPLLLIIDGIDEVDSPSVSVGVQSLFPHRIPENVALVCTGDPPLGSATTVVMDLDGLRYRDIRGGIAARQGFDSKAVELLQGNLLALRLAGPEPRSFIDVSSREDDQVSGVAGRVWSSLAHESQRLLGIVAAAYEPLTWWRITEAAGRDRSREPSETEALSSWLVTGKTPDFQDTFAVAHEYLRRLIVQFRGDAHENDHAALLSAVAQWTPRDRGEFQKEYSLRYALLHAMGARNSEAIEKLATSLDFLEQRLRLDPPEPLVEEMMRARSLELATATVNAVADALAEHATSLAQDPSAVRFVVQAALRLTGSTAPLAGRAPRVRLRHGVRAPMAAESGHRGAVRGCLPFGHEEVVSWSVDGTVKVWGAHDGDLLTTITGHAAEILGCDVSADAIVTGGRDCGVRVWSRTAPLSRLLLLHNGPVLGLRLHGDRIISWDGSGGLAVSSLSSPAVRMRQVHEQAVTACLVRPDLVATGSADNTIRIWSTDVGEEFMPMAGHFGAVTTLAWSDAHNALVSGAEDGTLRLWSRRGGALLSPLQGHESAVLRCITIAGGARVVSCSRDHSLRVWDLQAGREVLRLAGHRGAVLGCVILPDTRLLSWSVDGTLRLWSLDDGTPRGILEGHTAPVNWAQVLTEGQVISCSDDRQLLRWRLGEWSWR